MGHSVRTRNTLVWTKEPGKSLVILQGGHKPGKHGKPGKLKETLWKTEGNLNFCRKHLENSGKMKNM